jgi:hypothetical protein
MVDPIYPVIARSVEDVLYGDRATSYRWEIFEHVQGIDRLVGVLDGVVEGSLNWTLNAAVKGAGSVTVTDLDQAAPGTIRIADLKLESVRLRPVQTIVGLPENPQGIFLVSAAKEDWEATGRTWKLELLDRTTVPSQDVVDEAYAVPAGSPILKKVRALLISCGEYIPVNESSTQTTSTGMVWEAGTSKLQIINDLLDVAGYNALWMDGYGNLQTTPRVLPADRSLAYDILGIPREMRDGEKAIYLPNWSMDRDSFNVPNKVIAVQSAGGEDEPAIVGVWTNEDPASPYSYQARGRWVPYVMDAVETPEGTAAETLAFLQKRAQTTLVAMSAVQATVKITHLPVPARVGDVFRFAHAPAEVDSRYVITSLDLELSSLGTMKSTLQEVITL